MAPSFFTPCLAGGEAGVSAVPLDELISFRLKRLRWVGSYDSIASSTRMAGENIQGCSRRENEEGLSTVPANPQSMLNETIDRQKDTDGDGIHKCLANGQDVRLGEEDSKPYR